MAQRTEAQWHPERDSTSYCLRTEVGGGGTTNHEPKFNLLSPQNEGQSWESNFRELTVKCRQVKVAGLSAGRDESRERQSNPWYPTTFGANCLSWTQKARAPEDYLTPTAPPHQHGE